jgi:drug/metabolite transporter (DMT)-like permease
LETVTETARVLLVGVVLTSAGLGAFVWRLVRLDPNEPDRLIAELRLSHWMGLTLATVGGAWIGLAAGRQSEILSGIDLTLSIAMILVAAWSVQRETRAALAMLCVAFLAHAIIDAAHRPNWLPQDVAPRWFALGCAGFNLYLSALCFWATRRRE